MNSIALHHFKTSSSLPKHIPVSLLFIDIADPTEKDGEPVQVTITLLTLAAGTSYVLRVRAENVVQYSPEDDFYKSEWVYVTVKTEGKCKIEAVVTCRAIHTVDFQTDLLIVGNSPTLTNLVFVSCVHKAIL